ncbi:MAG: efflux transporter outer membrane subunit [Planctomycetes bacterium]|nr:efflux transporter outer membrane subunit [Planctomycetota bacterium]
MIRGYRAWLIRPEIFPALALLLAGCAVGPNYTQPEVATPVAFAEAPAAAVSSEPPDLSRWWSVFGDAELDSLVERALSANLDLRIAGARLREARALRGVAAADRWPELDASGSYSRTRRSENAFTGNSSSGPSSNSGFSSTRENDLYQLGFDASWEVDLFGHVQRSVEAADADLGAAEWDRRDVLVSVLAEVARNYVELRGAQRELAITRENVRAQSDTLDLTRSRFDAGLATDLDVARARAQVATTTSQIPTFETTMKAAAHRLAVLLGQEPNALAAELGGNAPVPTPPARVPVGLPADLLRRRPDVRRAEREVAAATARIGMATADLYPRFSLTGSLGVSSVDGATLFDEKSVFSSIGPSFTWPIFAGGRIRQGIAVQDARTDQALARYGAAVLGALEDVENALVAWSHEQTRRASLDEAVTANRRAADLAMQLHQNGLVDFLNVLQAQQALFVSESQLVESDTAVASRLVALYKALGGGWESEPHPE